MAKTTKVREGKSSSAWLHRVLKGTDLSRFLITHTFLPTSKRFQSAAVKFGTRAFSEWKRWCCGWPLPWSLSEDILTSFNAALLDWMCCLCLCMDQCVGFRADTTILMSSFPCLFLIWMYIFLFLPTPPSLLSISVLVSFSLSMFVSVRLSFYVFSPLSPFSCSSSVHLSVPVTYSRCLHLRWKPHRSTTR